MPHFPIPEPQGRTLVGHLPDFKKNPLACMSRWHRDYGDIVRFRLGPQKMYLLSHPDLVEEALIEQQDIFVKMYDPQKPKGLQLILGQGLVTSKGALWQQQRRLMQPVFQRRNILSLLPLMTEAGTRMMRQWQGLAPAGEVEISAEMLRLTLEVLTRTMFSTSVLDRIDVIAPALDACLRFAAASFLNPLGPPLWFPTRTNREFKQALAALDAVIYRMIDERQANNEAHDDLLALLLKSADPETGTGMSRKQLRDEMLTIFVAGHETTANVMTWTLYYLARHPEVMAKLRTELKLVLNGGIATPEQLDQLPYTKAVLFETMRLRPPAALLIRKIERDTRLKQHELKAGGLAMLSIYNIHHHPGLWQNPECFDPERFIDRKISKYAFFPFGVGSRFCIGHQFATVELTLLLSMLAQHFDFSLCCEREPEIDMAVTIRPKGGLKLSVSPRGTPPLSA
ncbi:MAG: cytochrome P450 [Gammaproteobacteria bacterium]